jgi:hypothetical protein
MAHGPWHGSGVHLECTSPAPLPPPPCPQTYPGLSNKPTLMDRFDYVMYGKVFRWAGARGCGWGVGWVG